jgi:soluble lytic murein transglycosylase
MITDKYSLERQIDFQQARISELETKLQVFQAIEDFQIGFSEDEVAKLTEVVYAESRKYEYDPMFVLAIILTESSFKRGQVSHMGARGLMQVVPYVGEDVANRAGVEWDGMETLFKPEDNIKLGLHHLFEQMLEFGDVRKALVAYNMGETRLRSILRKNKPLPKDYLNRVIDNYTMLKEKYPV